MSARRQGTVLELEGHSLEAIAERFGTPLFVYGRASIEAAWRRFDTVLAHRPHLVCYAVKANSTLAVLDVLVRLGSGFDIVSGGELKRVLAAGGRPDRVVFSGVGKSAREMELGLEAGIRCFNVESSSELERLSAIAYSAGITAAVSFRINPDVDAGTHPYISTGLRENKFGIGIEDALDVYRRAADLPGIRVTGVDCHIGSQLLEVDPYRDAFARLVALIDRLAESGIVLDHIDVGGGQGIDYGDARQLDLTAWAAALDTALGDRALEVVVEPGRAIVGEAGVLLTRVEYLKRNGDKRFAIVDAAMNDLLRPALYAAHQPIEAVRERDDRARERYDIVGPVCESADFLGRDRSLAIEAGDLLAVLAAGAYGAVMSSNYNTRPRAAEVLIDGDSAHLVRAREEVEALFDHEYLLP